MRSDGFVSINWGGKSLTPEEQLVMVKVAALLLKDDRKRSSVDFTHELIDGRLTHESSGIFVTVVGNFFRAELGEVDGRPWYHEFLLMRGLENSILENDVNIYYVSGSQEDVHLVDPKLTKVTSVSLLS